MDADPPDAEAAKLNTVNGPSIGDGSSADDLCMNCGQPLIPGGTPGECLRCLVNFASIPTDKEFEAELTTADVLTKRRRYGHFEIVREADGSSVELGRGAMGTTYRATDTVLHRVVALKVIERRVAAHPAARTRFLREARAAAQFQHPNVAAVSHYGEEAGECFYAMELVEGETLEARVRREGSLSAASTVEIATQIARALAAAETRGIIHRDLKPTNLMLAHLGEQGRRQGVPLVKVIDFGLAKAVSAAGNVDGTFETHGGFVGTPAFASPEQFVQPRAGQVDHRSDIYSLGVTMWYALCGQPPFAGRDLETIRSKQLERLSLDQLTAHRVPRRLSILLRSMLAVDPTQRPQSARELLDRLDQCRDGLPLEPGARRKRRGQWLIVTTLLLAAAAVAIRLLRHPSTPLPEDRSIAVLPFENLSPDPADAFYTTGVQDEITANLAHIAALKVIDVESVGNYPPGKRDFARIGSELGVRHLVEGSVRRENGQVHETFRLIDMASPKNPWTGKYDRPLSDSFALQSEVTRAIADQLKTPISHDEKAAVNAPPTDDPVAYDLYLRARENFHFWVNTPDLLKKADGSLRLLNEAVARDPKFALAYCAIAGIHDAVYRELGNTKEDDPRMDRRAAAESALQTARRLRPDAGEVHLAQAKHLDEVNWDYPQARIEIELARRTLPNNADLERIDAHLLTLAGRWEQGAHALERAAKLDPRNPSVFEDLEIQYREIRQYDNAERALAGLTALTPGKDAFPVRVECALEAIEARADLAPLRAALASTPPDGGPSGVNIFRLQLAYLDRDADGLAREIAAAPEQHFEIYGMDFPTAWFVGLEARLRGDPAGAKRAFEAARESVAAAAAADPGYKNARTVSLLALIDAGLGRTDDAIREATSACEMLPETLSAQRPPILNSNLAIVYAWVGQPDRALARLEPWIKKPAGYAMVYSPTYGDLMLNPMWDQLRTDKRFTVMIEQLAPQRGSGAKGQ